MSATTTTTATTSITTTVTAESDHGYVSRGGPVSAELSFFVPPADGSVPYNYVEQPPGGKPKTNVVWQPREVRLDDIRGNESAYNLDKDAFQVHSGVQSATTYETFNSDEEVRRVYYPEVERLLLDKVDGAHKVILFDHTIRRQDPNAPRQPVNMAHGDQTDRATEWRVRLHVEDPAEAERLLQGRYRIINVWRPINGVVQSAPLAIASAASGTPDKDMVPIEHRYPTRTGEILGVVYNPDTRWHYWSGVNDDERIFLKCSDINPPAGKAAVGKRCPHTAFADPRTPDGAKPRESIEVRALVFG